MYEIIIPTYNERKNIKPLFTAIHDVFTDINQEYCIILVDDNSPDKTYEEALKFKSKVNLKTLQRKEKLGLGSAYKYALSICEGDYVVILDADLSHNPQDIKKMIKEIKNGYDIVCGSRYMSLKESGVINWSFKRRLISRGANFIARFLLGIKTSDCTGSFRVYRREVISALLGKVSSTGFAYQMEILYLAEKNKFKVAEVPIIFSERLHGESKMGLIEIYKFCLAIFYCLFRIY